jgi:uncharacterized protein with von Willebrand factor type A (vWA) domain
MADPTALARLLDELVWMLRREGFVVAPSQMIDVLSIVRVLGWDDPMAIREGIAAVVVERALDRPRFDAAFTEFFSPTEASLDLWERLRLLGFTHDELVVAKELLEALAAGGGEGSVPLLALLDGGMHIDSLLQLAGIQRELGRATSPLQAGFVTQRAGELAGLRVAHGALARLKQALQDALGARGDELAVALSRELEQASDLFRARLRASLARRIEEARAPGGRRTLDDTPFTSLTDGELIEVRRAVRTFAERMRGAERVRLRRARRGRIDVSRTLRTCTRTGGVPFKPVRRRRRRDKPQLLLLCDISDSVRTASRFMLELLYAAHELFDRTRSFVFVSELGETTSLFERELPNAALAAIYGGAVVPMTDNSNYGRVLRQVEAHWLKSIDTRTTVVVLGDGRTNYHDAAESVLGRIRARARAVYWLCPELRTSWLEGDSAMPRYAPLCTRVFEVTTARELEIAARALVSSR